MAEAVDLKTVVEDIVSSYETKVESISSIFDSASLILGDVQQSILDTKEEREKTNTQLKDILARNEHLRKKDFDNMMGGILVTQNQREKEVRELLNDYFNEQKSIAQALRDTLGKIKVSLARGEAARIKEFQSLIKEILAKQDERKNEVTSKLKEFQEEQRVLTTRLKELLAKGRGLRIKDFKLMLKEFKIQRGERLVLQKKRKKEVTKMLTSFRKARRKATSSPKVRLPLNSQSGQAIHPTPFTTKNLTAVKEGGVNIDTQDGQKV